MRKCLLVVMLLLVSQLNYTKAQGLFNAPDTVCERQPIQLTSNVNASSYYWGFCSGFLFSQPVGNNLGTMPDLSTPGAMEIAKDGINYYGFVGNIGTNELVRFDFGTSLSNTPTVTNLGTLNNTMPDGPTKLFITNDGGNWFMFATGGSTQATSSIARIDFGNSLANLPNSVNFGNIDNVLAGPRGIFVQKEGTDYIGYVVNNVDDHLIRLDFGSNISFTPVATDLLNNFLLSNPTDIAPVLDTNGDWYLFVTNQTSSTITKIFLGNSLMNVGVPTDIGDAGGKLFGPTGITFVRDCGFMHFFVTNGVSSDFIRIDMPDLNGPYTGTTPFTGVGSLALPSSITHIIRDGDNLYAFITNAFGNSVSRIDFPQCTTTNIASSMAAVPPPYAYYKPGTYNVYFVINEGLPNMQVECKQIEVLKTPPMSFHNDTTICQGDTITLFIQAFGAMSFTWYPDYNISHTFDSLGTPVKVWPEYTLDYHVVLPYANGCIVDTPVTVAVSKNKADAGPDRTIYDGAKTALGGPMTSVETPQAGDPEYTYTWIPNQFISSTTAQNPVASPPFDFTYYLEVRNDFGCYDIDTVVIRVTCNDLNLPNAFAPESGNPASNRFGVLNKQIVKLNYLRVFDRWGKLVFETDDLTGQWDGTVNNEPAPLGVYVWEADGFCIEGQRFKRSGNVTLIR